MEARKLIFMAVTCSFVIQLAMGQTYTYEYYEQQRYQMVERQIVRRGVADPEVLEAMRKVERHKFVTKGYERDAYDDCPLPIGYQQTISQPYIVAFMTEALELKPEDRVLEIGTGSGYQAAVLAEICDSVFSIEIIEPLSERASEIFKALGYDNVYIKTGDGYQGWPEKAPFDAIIVTCSPTHVPGPLEEQLAEGGVMIIPVGNKYAQELVLLEKRSGKLEKKSVLPVRFVPMIDKKGAKY
jgi:protein-L-isoaspartate(D-aspartate) O-methyltransferase